MADNPDTPTTAERLDALEAENAVLRRAVAEIGLPAVTDLAALVEDNALHGSAHVQARIAQRYPATAGIITEYLGGADSYSARIARTVTSMQQAHREAERGAVEGAIYDRRRDLRHATEGTT